MKRILQEMLELLSEYAYQATPERKELASTRLSDHEAYLRGESNINPYLDKEEWFKNYI